MLNYFGNAKFSAFRTKTYIIHDSIRKKWKNLDLRLQDIRLLNNSQLFRQRAIVGISRLLRNDQFISDNKMTKKTHLCIFSSGRLSQYGICLSKQGKHFIKAKNDGGKSLRLKLIPHRREIIFTVFAVSTLLLENYSTKRKDLIDRKSTAHAQIPL